MIASHTATHLGGTRPPRDGVSGQHLVARVAGVKGPVAVSVAITTTTGAQ
jgi:hypothetical protein